MFQSVREVKPKVIDERLRDGCVLGRAFDQRERMFDALPIDPDRSDQDEILADVNAVSLMH